MKRISIHVISKDRKIYTVSGLYSSGEERMFKV